MRLSRISAVFFDSQPNFSRNFNLRKNAANPNISRIFLQPAEFKKKMRLRGLIIIISRACERSWSGEIPAPRSTLLLKVPLPAPLPLRYPPLRSRSTHFFKARSALRSRSVDFWPAPLRFPLRSRSANMVLLLYNFFKG